MNSEVLRKYLAGRAKGVPAIHALRHAKATNAVPAYPFLADIHAGADKVSGTVGPFTVCVKIVPVEDSQLGDDDVTGTFTDKYESGCVENTYRNWGTDYKYYQPSNYTLNYAYDDMRKAGMSKGVARDAVRERIREEMRDDANREYYGVDVSVSVAGRTLADASLWSIDTIAGNESAPHFIDVATDLIGEAIGEARKAIPGEIERNADAAHALTIAASWQPSD